MLNLNLRSVWSMDSDSVFPSNVGILFNFSVKILFQIRLFAICVGYVATMCGDHVTMPGPGPGGWQQCGRCERNYEQCQTWHTWDTWSLVTLVDMLTVTWHMSTTLVTTYTRHLDTMMELQSDMGPGHIIIMPLTWLTMTHKPVLRHYITTVAGKSHRQTLSPSLPAGYLQYITSDSLKCFSIKKPKAVLRGRRYALL